MSQEQLDAVVGIMRQGAGPDLSAAPTVAREQFDAMLANIPSPEGLTFSQGTAGGVPAMWSDSPEAAADRTLLYLHGGAFVIGNAVGYRPVWGGLARAAGARGLAIDYRLAPEHPFPAAVDDAVAAYRWLLAEGRKPGSIVIAGDSAGGGLTVSMLVKARDEGLPMPAAALAISPWADLQCVGQSIVTKAEADPALDKAGLVNMAAHYLGGRSPREPLASPIHADLRGLPPLLIQVGSAEILLDDAIRLAGVAGAADVRTTLEVWPGMPHVWHAFGFMLDEGRDATDRAGEFFRSNMA